eukprot:GHVU01129797.1.p1 GENE.GHVU01129797.1~~GHVU01129797.1.p1  ORF type:complete len:158 (+),score=16.13 GHVU01129797.1:565-1038(+)
MPNSAKEGAKFAAANAPPTNKLADMLGCGGRTGRDQPPLVKGPGKPAKKKGGGVCGPCTKGKEDPSPRLHIHHNAFDQENVLLSATSTSSEASVEQHGMCRRGNRSPRPSHKNRPPDIEMNPSGWGSPTHVLGSAVTDSSSRSAAHSAYTPRYMANR